MSDIVDKTIKDLQTYHDEFLYDETGIHKSVITNAIKVIEQLRNRHKELIHEANVESNRAYDTLNSLVDCSNALAIEKGKRVALEEELHNLTDEATYLKGQNHILDELKRFIKQNDLRSEPLNSPFNFGSRSSE